MNLALSATPFNSRLAITHHEDDGEGTFAETRTCGLLIEFVSWGEYAKVPLLKFDSISFLSLLEVCNFGFDLRSRLLSCSLLEIMVMYLG